MVMERQELEKILTHFQGRARGYLLRKEVRHARADFEDLVREIDGNLNHLQWRDGIISTPHFTDTDGPLQRQTSSSSAPTPKLNSPETHAPEQLLEKTEEHQQLQQLFPEKVEAERDGVHFQVRSPPPRECPPAIPAGGLAQSQADSCHSPRDSRGSTADSPACRVWGGEEPEARFTPSDRGPQQHRLARDVPPTREALRLHRNALSMELLWLQQAISSRKKYLSLKQSLAST